MKELLVYPEVQKIEIKGKPYRFNKTPRIRYQSREYTYNKIIRTWCKFNRYQLLESNGDVELILNQTNDENITYIEENNSLTNEKYTIEVSFVNREPLVNIRFSHKRGLMYALFTLQQMINADKLYNCYLEDYPKFNIRGIIEGYYGPPWKDEDRKAIFSLLLQYKMNTYFYGPKDDPYHRKLWRVLYPTESLSKLKKLFNRAQVLEIDFFYSIGPGLSIRYSDKRDFELLLEKIKQIHSIGIKNFGFFLDDIPPILQHGVDKKVYEDLVSAHIDIISRLFSYLKTMDSEIRLVVCPTQYYGKGNEYYISKLGRNLDPLIDIFWTGPEICSRELNLYDASVFRTSTYHKPLYWDNYPVNDLEMSEEMHIGPYLNRDMHLYRCSRGIISNGMQYAEASKIPFITIACYLWNPEKYKPQNCWEHAIKSIVGEEDSEDFLVFADNVRYSAIYPSNSPKLENIITNLIFEYYYGNRERGFYEFDRAISQYLKASEKLLKGIKNGKLAKELEPWLNKFSKGIELFVKTVDCLKDYDKNKIDNLKELYKNYQADKTKVFADVLYPFVESVLEGDFHIKDQENYL